VAGSIPWNSKGSTRGGDERRHTGVRGVPDWRCLDLLGRSEVKRPIVQSARGMELLLEEEAAEWQDIRIKHNRNWCQDGQNAEEWSNNRIILQNDVLNYLGE